MTNQIEHHDVIKNSLFQFINNHIPGANLCIVDEIVLAYVVSVLEEASQDDAYEVEEFIDMMSAYFPKFSDIQASTVCTWITELNNQLSSKMNKNVGTSNLPVLNLK